MVLRRFRLATKFDIGHEPKQVASSPWMKLGLDESSRESSLAKVANIPILQCRQSRSLTAQYNT